MSSDTHPTQTSAGVLVIVTAYNEADRIATTISALADAFPDAPIWVADDGSTDHTAEIAEAAGARVVRSGRMIGKGGAATLAANVALQGVTKKAHKNSVRTALSGEESNLADGEPIVVLCDGDLGDSAKQLGELVESVQRDDVDMTVAVFARRVGGGLGLAVGFAGWAIRRRCGLKLRAPISGQRAMRASVLAEVLPFAPGFGMEIGMTIDAARADKRVREVELNLSHRATGRTFGGFAHRGRQLIDFVRVYLARR